jgi:ABC-type metal ion transport system substrate-binding protein
MSSLEKYTFLQPTFWSYHLSDLDQTKHKNLIVKQILNHGDDEALRWLQASYSSKDIKEVIEKSMVSEWSKKSLNLWTLIYSATPSRQSRFT